MSILDSPTRTIGRYLETPKLTRTPNQRSNGHKTDLDTPFLNSLAGLSAAKFNLKPLHTGEDLNIRLGTPKLVPNTPISKRHNSSKKLFGIRKDGCDECKFITTEVGKDEEGNELLWSNSEVILLKQLFNQYTNEGLTLVDSLALISRKMTKKDVREVAFKLKSL